MSNAIDPATLSTDLGGHWHLSYGTAPCPVCQQERRKDQNALTISAEADRLLLHCKKGGCDFKDILIAAGLTPGTFEIDQLAQENTARERAKAERQKLTRARSLWDYSDPMAGTAAETYLRGRGITCTLPQSLRWLPDTYHMDSAAYIAAMIADIQPTGGVHRTFFDKKGQRLTKSAKMMYGPCSGGGVILSETPGPLVVCEGIETGLSLLSGLLDGPHSVTAALSTSGIRAFTLPRQAHSLIIATDGDEAGAAAGKALASRAYALGWEVSMMPAPDGQDWSDVLQGEVAA